MKLRFTTCVAGTHFVFLPWHPRKPTEYEIPDEQAAQFIKAGLAVMAPMEKAVSRRKVVNSSKSK